MVLFSSCVNIYRENTDQTVIDYYNQGLVAYQNQAYPNFLEYMKRAVKLAPKNPRTMFHLSKAYSSIGNKKLAIKWLDRSVSMGSFIHVFSSILMETPDERI